VGNWLWISFSFTLPERNEESVDGLEGGKELGRQDCYSSENRNGGGQLQQTQFLKHYRKKTWTKNREKSMWKEWEQSSKAKGIWGEVKTCKKQDKKSQAKQNKGYKGRKEGTKWKKWRGRLMPWCSGLLLLRMVTPSQVALFVSYGTMLGSFQPWLFGEVIVSSELLPWSNSGGLGRVTASLSQQFAMRGHRTMQLGNECSSRF